jgi:hypothetical protein
MPSILLHHDIDEEDREGRQDPAFLKKLENLAPGLDYWEAPDRVFISPRASETRAVYHLLNNNYKSGPFVDQRDFDVKVALPEGLSAEGKTLKFHAPGRESLELEFSVMDGYLSFTLPEPHIWAAVELS